MLRQVRPPSLKDYLTVKEAASLLGVTPITLRRWDRKGKLTTFRHPINHYRLYNKKRLMKLLSELAEAGA